MGDKMPALETPPIDAPAEEWGRLAVSIPDWRWPWDNAENIHCPPMPGWVCVAGLGWTGRSNLTADSWEYTDDLQFVHGDGRLIVPRQEILPDPDHWAWTGWMLRMLGNLEKADELADELGLRRDECAADAVIDAVMSGAPGRISRACIAAAAALGRWPGGEG